MQKYSLKCERREKSGSAESRRLRRAGFIPCILYSKDLNIPIKVRREDILKLAHTHGLENIIIELSLKDEEKSYPALVKEVQYHPVSDDIIHIDFFKISMEEKIVTKVPIELKGEAVGVKKGGVLEFLLRELEIECLVKDLPEKIEVDISDLDIADSIHVGDLELPENLKVLNEEEEVIVTCAAPEEMPVEEEVAPEAESEPEVIKEKKKEEEEETK